MFDQNLNDFVVEKFDVVIKLFDAFVEVIKHEKVGGTVVVVLVDV